MPGAPAGELQALAQGRMIQAGVIERVGTTVAVALDPVELFRLQGLREPDPSDVDEGMDADRLDRRTLGLSSATAWRHHAL